MTELQEKIIELRKQGVGQKTISKQTGCTLDKVRRICKKNGLNGFLALQPLSDDDAKAKIENATQHFEYIGGWESCDKYIYLQCRWCGNMFKHSAGFTKLGHSGVQCPKCLDLVRVHKEKEKQKQIQKREKQSQTRKEFAFWSQPFVQMQMRKCKNCGQLFVPQHSRQHTCQTACTKHFEYKKRFKKRESYRYDFPLETLYKRDKGICYLCGMPVDLMDYRINDGTFLAGPNYPSRDHVKPQSKGGEHSWDNIKLTHFRCNMLKSNKIYT